MPGYYVYLISSLPMLRFMAHPPFQAQKLLDMCAGLVPDKDIEELRQSLNIGKDFIYSGPREALRKWCSFNIALNNEIVKIRAGRRHLVPEKYLRKDGYGSFDVVHIATASHRGASLLEGERILDQARWEYLEELSLGHYFDLELLFIYLQKLLILERWQRINGANKQELLDSALTKR